MSVTPRSLGRHALAFLFLITSLVLVLASPAAAHTGFESSSPADGETITEPVFEISLTFAGEATPAGDGFVVLDPDGLIRTPDEVLSGDNLTWTLRFTEPLTDGVVGVRWKVAAPDAHPIEGSFSFTVDAPAIATEAPSTSVPSSEPEVATTPPDGTASTNSDETAAELTQEAATEPAATSASAETSVALDEFLDTSVESASGVARVGDIGRALGVVGFVLAFGGVAFAALALRGDESDIRAVLFWVRRAAVVVMIGVTIRAAAQVATLASDWSGLWSPSALSDALVSSFGAAVLLRLAGGVLIATGAKLNTQCAHVASDPVATVKQLAAVGAGTATVTTPSPGQSEPPIVHEGDNAWHIAKSPAAFVGAAVLALSYLFDGHTVSEGPRWLHALANSVHVVTAATWAGGVVMLALVIARRHRRNADLRALQLAVRFSVVAVIALVGASAAGVALTVVILDSVSEIWTTPWGQLLVVKTLLVSVAAAGGGYNHRVVIPALERSPNDEAVAHRFRTIVTLEAVALVTVAVVTGLLVAASSS